MRAAPGSSSAMTLGGVARRVGRALGARVASAASSIPAGGFRTTTTRAPDEIARRSAAPSIARVRGSAAARFALPPRERRASWIARADAAAREDALASSSSSSSSSSDEHDHLASPADETHGASSPSSDAAFWHAQVTGPSVRQTARRMARRLDFANPLGVNLSMKGASTTERADGTRPASARTTLYDYAKGVKATHPRKVLLVRVGEFYEAIGYDAVMLVMHAGLNPMGVSGVPRAGCPIVKVRSISHWSPYDRVGVVNADP
jgi:hypothetical protein